MNEQEPQPDKPRFVLGRPTDFSPEGLAKFCLDFYTALTGKEPTPEEIKRARATFGRKVNDE